jgi:hypothetical protein
MAPSPTGIALFAPLVVSVGVTICKTAIVITSHRLSGEMSAQVYRAGATAVVPLGALRDAIANLTQVFEAGNPERAGALEDRCLQPLGHPSVVARRASITLAAVTSCGKSTPSRVH